MLEDSVTNVITRQNYQATTKKWTSSHQRAYAPANIKRIWIATSNALDERAGGIVMFIAVCGYIDRFPLH